MVNETYMNKISEAMKQLSEEHREVLILISIQKISYKDAANVLGKTENTIRQTLSAARASLEILLETPVPAKAKIFAKTPMLGFIPAFTQEQQALTH